VVFLVVIRLATIYSFLGIAFSDPMYCFYQTEKILKKIDKTYAF